MLLVVPASPVLVVAVLVVVEPQAALVVTSGTIRARVGVLELRQLGWAVLVVPEHQAPLSLAGSLLARMAVQALQVSGVAAAAAVGAAVGVAPMTTPRAARTGSLLVVMGASAVTVATATA